MYNIIVLSVITVLVSAEYYTANNGVVRADGTETADKNDRLVDESQYDAVVSKDPVVYDAYFGKPLTSKRQDFLANVVNGSA